MRTVAVDILTGFLEAARRPPPPRARPRLEGKPVRVIMNEIGEIGIDGRVVTGLSAVEKMVELSSGCICCNHRRLPVRLAIQEIVETVQPHVIIIESPACRPRAARRARARRRTRARCGDHGRRRANAERHLAESDVTARQIAAADFVVVNKIDLVDARPWSGSRSAYAG